MQHPTIDPELEALVHENLDNAVTNGFGETNWNRAALYVINEMIETGALPEDVPRAGAYNAVFSWRAKHKADCLK